MPRLSARQAYLRPELQQQLRLFGTAQNAFRCLGLSEVHAPYRLVARALSGYNVPARVEQLLEARWAEWRSVFLAPPENAALAREREARALGDYYHEAVVRDPTTEQMAIPFPRFTLADNPGKHL